MGNKNNKNKAKNKTATESKTPKKPKAVFKVMTLGLALSGKSTFAKQMRILYCGGFTDDETQNFSQILKTNILVEMQELVKKVERLDLQISEDNRKRARFFVELIPTETQFTAELAKKMEELSSDPVIVQARKSFPEFQMPMLDYFVSNLDRISRDDFVPSNMDILIARQRTTGTIETTFMIEKYQWNLVDVGGQKPERSKWDSFIDESLNAIIFFVALDEYNVMSLEDSSKSKLQLAVETYSELLHSTKNQDIALIIFLNKFDLFTNKINNATEFESYQKFFPEYSGGKDPKLAAEHIKSVFQKTLGGKNLEDFRAHVTCALDTEAMDKVFHSVKETIFFGRLKNTGIAGTLQ